MQMSKYLPLNLFIRQALLYPLTSPFLPPEAKVEDGYSFGAGKLEGSLPSNPPRGLPKTGQTDFYRTGGDGDLEVGLPETPPRFTDNGNLTITDNATGLMWLKTPEASLGAPFTVYTNWNNSIDACLAVNFAGHDDWRLPNQFELYSICDLGRISPAIDPTFFPEMRSDRYWSSTTYKGIVARAWYITMTTSAHSFRVKTDVFCRPIPVRLGVGAP